MSTSSKSRDKQKMEPGYCYRTYLHKMYAEYIDTVPWALGLGHFCLFEAASEILCNIKVRARLCSTY